nr:MAG TPA: hypothetical protein [Caudoviricetes sp.]
MQSLMITIPVKIFASNHLSVERLLKQLNSMV